VLVDVDHSMKCMQDETFGPTIPIMKIKDTEEGVQLANDSRYGLQASVWTKDVKRGEELARRIEAGVVCVNDAQINYTALNLPMGGWKASGLGSRHGANGIRKYCKVQSLLVTRRALKREPFMFPYKAGRTMMLRRLFKVIYGRGSRD
jgi:acyl-CoA reductase-like NAD-dependent aldehyde dehydrogenase